MLKTYLTTALRNLVRHLGHSIINVAGLAVGLAVFVLILLLIRYEQSFDTFHAHQKDLYRVVRVGKNPVNREYRTGVPFPVTSTLRKEFPQLKNAGAIYALNDVQVNVLSGDGSTEKKFKLTNSVFVAEPEFFKIFNFGLAAGDAATALDEPNTVLLTQEVASRYFDDERLAVGKTLRILGLPFKVTGILKNPPPNTDFPLGIVLSFATMANSPNSTNWSNIDDQNNCFVQLPATMSAGSFNHLLAGFVDRHIRPVNPGYDLVLQPLSDLHFDERFGNFSGRTFSSDLIFALRLIGIFLLVIACANFINLTTARAVNRTREVGVRKVLGGNRLQLMGQFLGETGVTTGIALIAAIGIVTACLPLVNNLLEIPLNASMMFSNSFVLIMLATAALVTALSGFYPAIVMSGFQPVNVLKGRLSFDRTSGVSFRRALVVFQFVIAQGLIIGTLVVASQMDYFRTADLGFRKDAVINATIPNDSTGRTKQALLQNELHKVPGIRQVSFSAFAPTQGGGWYTDLRLPDQDSHSSMVVCMKPADTAYFALYNLKIIAGRLYFPSDTVREFVINETAVKDLGIKSAADAIGKLINVSGQTFPVVGVVQDFHVNSLRDPIGPVVLTTISRGYGLVNVSIEPQQTETVLSNMAGLWTRLFPDYVFEYSFLDQSIEKFYKQENQLSKLYSIFSAIAIFISCLGLYGLIAFLAVQRRKEMGIRKVLGARVAQIVLLLSREFTLLIALSFVIASPIAWYYLHEWLQQYTYRIVIGSSFFVLTLMAALAVAWLAVGYTAFKAATANPVRSLRTE